MKIDRGVTAVIPVKPWALSKSRLEVGDQLRQDLARAFALDVIEAVSGSLLVGRIVLVTAESELGSVAAEIGAVMLADRPTPPPGSLDVAVESGRQWAMARRPTWPVVVVPGDLPSLTIAAFDHTISRLRRHDKAFVPDAFGRGTTFTWVSSPLDLQTSYGLGSADRHLDAGFRAVADVDVRARWDVDTLADLTKARFLGVGSHTSTVLDGLRTAKPSLAAER